MTGPFTFLYHHSRKIWGWLPTQRFHRAIWALYLISLLWGLAGYDSKLVWQANLLFFLLLVFLLAGIVYIANKCLVTRRSDLFLILLAVTGAGIGIAILQTLFVEGPWHQLAIHNDAAHALEMARKMADGERPSAPFVPEWLGRVAFTMNIEAIYIYFFGVNQFKYLIGIFQTLFSALIALFALSFFRRRPGLEKPLELNLFGSSVLVVTTALGFSFFPYVFMNQTHLDMYFLAPIWMLFCLMAWVFLDSHQSDRYYLLFMGALIGIGLLIAPSVKMISVALVLIPMIRLNARSCFYLLMGYGISAVPLIGPVLDFGMGAFGREQDLLQSRFLDPLAGAPSKIDFIWEKFQALFLFLLNGEGSTIIFDRTWANSDLAIFSVLSLIQVVVLLCFKTLRIPVLAILAITFAQLFVSEPYDYRLIHSLPLWALSIYFFLFTTLVHQRKTVRILSGIALVYCVYFQASLFQRMNDSVDYLLHSNFQQMVKANMWTSHERWDDEIQVATLQWGISDFFVPPEQRKLGLSFCYEPAENKIRLMTQYIEENGALQMVIPHDQLDILKNQLAANDGHDIVLISEDTVRSRNWPQFSAAMTIWKYAG